MTAWAWLWSLAANPARRSPGIGRLWRSASTIQRCTTTWAAPWPLAAGSRKLSSSIARSALDPQDPTAHYNLANALAALGKLDEAIERYQTALQSQPDNVQAYNNLGIALASRGRLDEAVVQFEQGLKIKPQDVGLHSNLANALSALGRHAEALLHYQTALEDRAQQVDTQKNLAWLRATCPEASLRNGAEALELGPAGEPALRGKTARRPGLSGRRLRRSRLVSGSPGHLAQALELARQQHAHALAAALQARIALYEAGKPFYQTPPSTLAPPPAR